MRFYWNHYSATVVYDLEQERFFCAADPAHRKDYFLAGRGGLCQETPFVGYGVWIPPLSAVFVGTYLAESKCLKYSLCAAEGFGDIRIFYPYAPRLERDCKKPEHQPIVLVKEPSGEENITAAVWLENFSLSKSRYFILQSDNFMPKGQQLWYSACGGFAWKIQLHVKQDSDGLLEGFPLYMFTKQWQKRQVAALVEELEKMTVPEAEQVVQQKYHGRLDHPFRHKFFQVPKWAPIWGFTSTRAVSWRRGFVETIPNPAVTVILKLYSPGWDWDVEDTCLVSRSGSNIRVLVNPFDPDWAALWQLLSKQELQGTEYDFQVPLSSWPWKEAKVEDMGRLLVE